VELGFKNTILKNGRGSVSLAGLAMILVKDRMLINRNQQKLAECQDFNDREFYLKYQ
jgi:hypothetical protein